LIGAAPNAIAYASGQLPSVNSSSTVRFLPFY